VVARGCNSASIRQDQPVVVPGCRTVFCGIAGAGFILNKSNLQYNNSTVFIYAPQLGIRLPVNRKHFLDAGVQYESSTNVEHNNDKININFLQLRIAYTFSL